MKEKMHKRSKVVGQVSRITLFPVKSMKGVDYEELQCCVRGCFDPEDEVFDRTWMVTDNHHRFVTARQQPKLLTIQPSFIGDDFLLDAPGMDSLIIPKVPCPHGHDSVTSVVWGEKVKAYDAGEKAAAWLSVYLGDAFRLVFHPQHFESRDLNRRADKWCSEAKDEDQIIYQDLFPYLLLSEASVDDLNSRLENPISVDNFRPNIVVSGCSAYDEDKWEDIYIGDARLVNVKPCNRCVLTTVDPVKGVKDPNLEPLKTLRKYRLWKEEFKDSPMFGINLLSSREGKIKVGDSVYATIKE
ncbi:hypothetical protein CAPTEDRAFT_226823 [Capitella teleta]|uniref:MOSC domain-containing protein n=1 Tax=Capitella teleta TaxID=283909 RepID=R7VF68_CAPTE|nr:hypothetical protein CAPTEDRAFT_226823 [Capitella teleta]|eukprot:ELU17202.1 hypothetical protein CAPTEDRAFT_226823 [Capitella teleta]